MCKAFKHKLLLTLGLGVFALELAGCLVVTPTQAPGSGLAAFVVSVDVTTELSGAADLVTLTALDATGAPLETGGLTVLFSNSGGTSTGIFSTTTDNGNGTYTATFTGVLAGTPTSIGASVGGSAAVPGGPMVQILPGAYSLSQSIVSVASGGDPSGSADQVTLTAKDAAGNLLTSGGLAITFSKSGGTSTGGFGAVTDHGNGNYTAAFTGVLAGTATSIGAKIGGSPVTSVPPAIVVSAGAASLSQSIVSVMLSGSDQSGSADTVTLTVKDAAGNALTAGGLTVVFGNSGGSSTGTFGATTDHGNGTYTASFTGVLAGTPTSIGATIGGSAVTSVAPTIQVGPGSYSLSQSVVTVASGANLSGATDALTLTAKDAAGNALTAGGLTVLFSNSGGTSTGGYSGVIDHGNGTYTATFTGVLAGTATNIGATIGGTAVTSAAPTITVSAGAYSLSQSVTTVAAALDVAGGTDALTLTTKDAAGNALTAGGLAVVFSNSGGTSTGSYGSVTDNGNGTYAGTFTGVLAGTATSIGATIGGSPITSAAPTITVVGGSQVSSNAFGYSSCALSSAGNVYCWGQNTAGQLGNNTTTEANTPVEVSGVGGSGHLSGIVSLAVGGNFACGVSSSGNLYCWGGNGWGQLGNNTTTEANTPIEVLGIGGSGFLSGIVSVTAGLYTTCALSSSGYVYCWGNNTYGQLGNNNTTLQTTPVEVEGVGAVGNLSGIVGLAAGSYQVCAASASGSVFCWGFNGDGQLANNSQIDSHTPVQALGVGGVGNLTGIVGLAGGVTHACAIDSSGNIYCWGDNTNGQLGNNSTTLLTTPIQVLGVGGVGNLSGAVSLTAGSNRTCVSTSAGNAYCWGYNNDGQLGNNTTTDAHTPVQVEGVGASGNLSGVASVAGGFGHSCALTTLGNIFCWGVNTSGQLGNNSTTEVNTPVEVQALGLIGGSSFFSIYGITPSQLSANDSGYDTCALSTSGNVFCWGNNSGNLGNNSNSSSSTAVEVEGVGAIGNLSGIVSLAMASDHSCGLTSSGNVYCWGSDFVGELGDGAPLSSELTPVLVVGVGGTGNLSGIVSLASGGEHTCALSSAGNVYCWGYNSNGQLGNNTTTNETTPVEVLGVGAVGYLSGIVSISGAYLQTCAISSAGNVYCWGYNQHGELGNNSTTDSHTPVEVEGVGGVGNLSGITSLVAGFATTCALSTSGNMYCWGYNQYGQIGNNTTTDAPFPVEVEGVGGVGNLSGVVGMSAGSETTCAVTSAGNAYCWGYNADGELGINSTTAKHTPVEVLGVGGVGNLSGLVSLAEGAYHTCAMTSSGNAYCWGQNTFAGQVGNNSMVNILTPAEVLGVGGVGVLSGI